MGRLRSIGNSFHTCPDGTPPRLATTKRMDYPTEGDRHLRRNFVLKNEEILRAGQRKMRDHRFLPLNFSGCGFFLAGCCSLAASSCFTSLIWSSILSNASGASFSPATRGRV
jgi:hypothetical protein